MSQSSQLDLFRTSLPRKPYCSNQKGFTLIRGREQAARMLYVQPNSPHLRMWLVYDVDRPGAAVSWQDASLPAPTWIASNPENGHAHLAYALDVPVIVGDNARLGPLRFAAYVDSAYCAALGADRGYAGLICKNPLRGDVWQVWTPGSSYDLGYLAEYINLPSANDKSSRQLSSYGLGRNCTLFENLRRWAYRHVCQYRAESSYDAWFSVVEYQCQRYNQQFDVPLERNETKHLVKSVAKWTWERYQSGLGKSKRRGVLGFGLTRHDDYDLFTGHYDPQREKLSEQERKERQRAGAKYSASIKRAETEAAIKAGITQLKSHGKRVTMAAAAKLAGVSHQAISKHYKHLFSPKSAT